MAGGGATQGPSFPGRGEWATLRGWGAEGEQFGMGQRAPRAGGDPRRRIGASGDSREVPRRAPPSPVPSTCGRPRRPPPHLAAGGVAWCGPRAPGGSPSTWERGARARRAARALGAGRRPLPPLPAALGRSSCQPSSEPASASQGGSGGGRRARGFLRPLRPLSRSRTPENEARVPHERRRWRQRQGTRRWRAEAAGEGDDNQRGGRCCGGRGPGAGATTGQCGRGRPAPGRTGPGRRRPLCPRGRPSALRGRPR